MKKPLAFLAYVVALAVFAGVAWQFREKPKPPDPEAMPADTWKEIADHGMDVPTHLYPENAYVDDLMPEGRRMNALRPDFSAFKPVLNDKTVRLYWMQRGMRGLPPFLLGLKRTGSNYTVFITQGGETAEAGLLCEKPLDTALAERVVAAWEKVLLETRPTNKIPYLGADGAFSHFGMVTRVGMMSGWMWDPQKPFKPGWLYQVAVTLRTSCGSGAPSGDLQTALAAIEAAP